jgi:ribosome-binding protein aMBF1 (putative translation factor)
MKNGLYTFQDDLKESLKDPEFRQAWQESEAEYLLACEIIEKRLAKKYSQRDLAKKVHTSQAAISRIESMNANPSLSFLKRIANALGGTITFNITPLPKP